MSKLSNIYGSDENSMANRISSDALENTAGKEDIWGAAIDQSARSKGNAPDKNEETVVTHNKGDSRATTKGNHGKQ
jgi:hypothetical protein